MSIKKMVENRVWDLETSSWVITAPKTHALAVETSDGGNVQDKLESMSTQITAAKTSAISEIRGGVADAGNTLSKLHALITALQELVHSDDVNLDTVQEIADYIKANRDDLTLMGTDKVNYTDVLNNLTTEGTVVGKVLDARQGKVIKDNIDGILQSIEGLQTQALDFATTQQLSDSVSDAIVTARTIVSEAPPANPVNGQLWIKSVGVIEL